MTYTPNKAVMLQTPKTKAPVVVLDFRDASYTM